MGIAILPLAALAEDAKPQIERVMEILHRRLAKEGKTSDFHKLTAITYLLMGVEYSNVEVREIMQQSRSWLEDSSTYHGLIEEGMVTGIAKGKKEAEAEAAQAFRHVVLHNGSKRFGAPTKEISNAIEAMTSLTELITLAEAILDCKDWADLLARVSQKTN